MRAAGIGASFCLGTCVVLASCNRPPAGPPSAPTDVWVTVNDRPISQGEVERLSHGTHQAGGAVTQKAVLDALISQELAAQEATKQGLTPDAAGQRRSPASKRS